MITNAEVQVESSTLDEIDVLNLVSEIRASSRYKSNPAYFIDVRDKIEELDGSSEAKVVNAIITKLEALGSVVVEINQEQTVGTDGVIYSQQGNREALIDYLLNVMYEESYSVVEEPEDGSLVLRGSYGVGRLPLEYKGYL